MFSLKSAVHIFTLLIVLLTGAAAAETAIIVHPSVADTLDSATVKKIFLGKIKSFPSGLSATPINLKEGTAVRTGFDSKILGKSSSQVKAYWSKLMFTGKGSPPKEVNDDASMKSSVASTPGAIGYIDAASVDDSVRTVLTF